MLRVYSSSSPLFWPSLPPLLPVTRRTRRRTRRTTNIPRSPSPANRTREIWTDPANGSESSFLLCHLRFLISLNVISNILFDLIDKQLRPIWLHDPRGDARTEKVHHHQSGRLRIWNQRGSLRQHQQGILLLGVPWRREIHFDLGGRWRRIPAKGRPLARRSRPRLRAPSCSRSRVRTPRCPRSRIRTPRRSRSHPIQRKGIQDFLKF